MIELKATSQALTGKLELHKAMYAWQKGGKPTKVVF